MLWMMGSPALLLVVLTVMLVHTFASRDLMMTGQSLVKCVPIQSKMEPDVENGTYPDFQAIQTSPLAQGSCQ